MYNFTSEQDYLDYLNEIWINEQNQQTNGEY